MIVHLCTSQPKPKPATLGGPSTGDCICMSKEIGLIICVYTDTDYAAASSDRLYVSGIAMALGDTAIGRKSSTQKCATIAACKAEYVGLCDASKEALFTRTVLVFLQPNLIGMRAAISVILRLRSNRG